MNKPKYKITEEICGMIATIVVIILLAYFFHCGFVEKAALIEKYNLGVQAYNDKNYIEAMDIFASFEKNFLYGTITTDEYYEISKNAALNNLENEHIEVIIRYATREEQREFDILQVQTIAKTVYGEARGCSKMEQAAVVWCILNRVDSSDFPNEIIEVCEQQNQFAGYNVNNPIDYEIVDLVQDVMNRWVFEKTSVGEVGRILPKEYLYFIGDGKKNYFRDSNGNQWNWTLESPYDE